MASKTQVGKGSQSQSKVATRTAHGAMPVAQDDAIDVGRGPEWLESTRSNQGSGARLSRRVVGGRWVQIVYALIDVICVLVNGTIAFLLRFSLFDLRHFFVSGHFTVATDQPVSRYAAFLLLYVALILLFCHLQ